MLDWRRMPVSSGAVHRRHVSCSHSHVSGHVMLGGLPDAAAGESVSVSSSTPWTAVSTDPPAWRQRGQPMQLTMATVAEQAAMQEDVASVAAAPAGNEPAAAGDGAGDDKPAELCTKRRKTHMPPEVKEWFCFLARAKPVWTTAKCLRFAKRALPTFEHTHIDTPRKWFSQKTSRYRSWPPALPGTRSCPGPGRHRVPRLQQSVLWIWSLDRTPERAPGDTWWRSVPLLRTPYTPIHAINLGTPSRNPRASSGRNGPKQRHGHFENCANRRSSGH